MSWKGERGVCLSDKSFGYRTVEALMRIYGTRRITDRSYEGLLRYARLRDAVLSGRPPRLMYARYEIAPYSVAGCPAIESDRRGNVRKRLCFFSMAVRLCCKSHPFITAGLRI